MRSEPILTSKQAANVLGVSEASIKRWADDGHLSAVKTIGGHRRFRPEDVANFRRRRSNREPHSPEPAHAPFPKVVPPGPRNVIGDQVTLVDKTYRYLLDGRSRELSSLLLYQYLHGWTVGKLADELICGAMRRVGELWYCGQLSIAEEHVATRTARTAWQRLQASLEVQKDGQMTAITCAAEGDFHELPVELSTLVLESKGLSVLDLGPSMPFFALAEAVKKFRPRLVCISSTIFTGIDRAVREYGELREAVASVGGAIVLGGPGFTGTEAGRRLSADLMASSFGQLDDFGGAIMRGAQ